MQIRKLAIVLVATVLTQTGCAIGFQGEAGRPVSPPVTIIPPDAASSRLDVTPSPEVPPRIQPVPAR
jgi:hypothetical protein